MPRNKQRKSFSFVFNNSGGFFVVLKVRGVFLIEILMENGRMENLVDELF
jgi:hypothetical protein